MFDEKNLHAASSVTMEKEDEAEHDELILNYEEEMDERFFDVTRSDHDEDAQPQPQQPRQSQEANSLLDNVAHDSSESYDTFRELAQSAFAAPSACSWHDAESDRPERQRMVIDISQLLYARKQGAQLTEQWLQELPHKARKLESCLYKQASSLEEYRNRETLKWRLQRIARSITRQFLQAKSKQQVLAAAANETCIPSNGRDSFSPRQRRRSTGNIKPRSLGGEQGNGSLRDILLTHGSAESFSSTDADAADKIDFARSGMLRPIRRSSAAAATTGDSLSMALASVPLEATSSDLMEQQSLETAQSLPSATAANASFEFGQQQPEQQQQQQLMGQEAAAATNSFYMNNHGLTSNHQLVETSESSATHREMQDLLTSQLLAQQQQIIRNIQQQEEMIQQLQQARLQQQGMPLGQHGGGVMMSADGSGNYAGPAAALYTPIQQMFIQEQERQQQLNAMYNGDFSSQQQFSMASLSTDQYTQSQMVMNGPMFQHQMGLPQTQLESQISMDFSNQSMLALDESARIQYALQNQQQQQQQQMLAPSQYSLMDGQQQQQQLLHPQQLLRSISGGMMYGAPSQTTYDAQLAMPYDKPGDGGGLLALDAALAAHHAKTTDETDTRQRKRLSKDSFRW